MGRTMDTTAILKELLPTYVLPIRGIHGVSHWARVLENGLRIAEVTGADIEVVTLFALFHDCRRANDGRDPDHGRRGAERAELLRGSLVRLSSAQFDLLSEACRLHTDGLTEGDPTVQACWDADRLDLPRVHIELKRRLICTEAAWELRDWARARAADRYEPGLVTQVWGV